MMETRGNIDPDTEMIRDVAGGDEPAFEELVAKYEDSVYNTIYRFTNDRDEAADIAQEVFVKVWRFAGSFGGRSKFSTWLYRIVVNECLRRRKARRNTGERLEEMDSESAISRESSEGLEQVHRAEAVRKEIAMLPEKQRLALLLTRFEGKSYKDVAEILGVSVSAVESLLFRARAALKKRLQVLKDRGEI
jgi:RNA polymerase sigma factor (sigma-70 family)